MNRADKISSLKLSYNISRIICAIHAAITCFMMTAVNGGNFLAFALIFIYCLLMAVLSGLVAYECKWQIEEEENL